MFESSNVKFAVLVISGSLLYTFYRYRKKPAYTGEGRLLQRIEETNYLINEAVKAADDTNMEIGKQFSAVSYNKWLHERKEKRRKKIEQCRKEREAKWKDEGKSGCT